MLYGMTYEMQFQQRNQTIQKDKDVREFVEVLSNQYPLTNMCRCGKAVQKLKVVGLMRSTGSQDMDVAFKTALSSHPQLNNICAKHFVCTRDDRMLTDFYCPDPNFYIIRTKDNKWTIAGCQSIANNINSNKCPYYVNSDLVCIKKN